LLKVQGVFSVSALHALYHSGTANTSDSQKHSIKEFVAYCEEQGVPVYAAPIAQTDDLYQSAKDLIDAGAKPIVGVSLEVALVKLMMKCVDDDLDINKPVYFEAI